MAKIDELGVHCHRQSMELVQESSFDRTYRCVPVLVAYRIHDNPHTANIGRSKTAAKILLNVETVPGNTG